MTTTVRGIILTRNLDSALPEWHGTIGGEAWRFYQHLSMLGKNRIWQGFTADKLTGTPKLRTLELVVRWVIEHQAEIAAKLAVRRKAGTRMVDPA